MITVTTSRHEAKYLASRALLAAGFSHEQVGLAMLALDDHDDLDPDTIEEPEYTEPVPFEPSEADWTEYSNHLERLEYERRYNANTLRPV